MFSGRLGTARYVAAIALLVTAEIVLIWMLR